ncbi:MAG: alanine--tRNA ligase [archaeon]
MDRKELIKKFLDFYKSKGHREIPNSSLIPENDPTVLFTTAGMHPIVPFLLGQPHPLGKRLCNVQRCIRTGDIEEVGDTYHHTFFEMVGKWSLGDYFKKEAIEYTLEFFTDILKLPKEKLAVSIFVGNKKFPRDEESLSTWKTKGIPVKRIALLKDNWWGPAGTTGPCGPCTEIFYWKPKKISPPEKFDPEDSRWVEIGNDVLMQYNKTKEGKFEELKQKNIDFGGGVERIIAVLNGLDDDYQTEPFLPIIKAIEKISEKKYGKDKEETRAMRIIADHIKASVFLIADGVSPSNIERGYVIRRLIRIAIRHGKKIGIRNFTKEMAEKVFEIYDDYERLLKNKEKILEELEKEEKKFNETLDKGIKIFEKMIKGKKELCGEDGFLLFQSYGFPIEMTKEISNERNIKFSPEDSYALLTKHQDLSRTASARQFKSGLADNSEATTKLHTATHLLAQALREVLNKPNLHQKGSNITAERARFDFNFDRKLTDEELKKVENIVNQKIKEGIPVNCEEISQSEAKKSGAQGIFDSKYGEKVSVYSIGNFSKEICAGPHVKNTKELGKFKIIKEESSSAGVRRIKTILE